MKYFIAALICVLFCGSAWADIYKYVGPDGVMYFSNTVSADSENKGYTFYMLETRRSEASYQIYNNVYYADPANNYDDIIRYAAHLYELDYELVKAVIKVESNFMKEAVSSKGACGLMQIMPATGQDLNLEQPFDPQSNILAGTNYLKYLIGKFKNLPLAIAAYNAGPGAVEKYNHSIPPYKETQNYVKKVLSYYEQFKKEELEKLNTYNSSSFITSYNK